MKVLNLIAHLLDYPSDELVKNLPELTHWVANEAVLDPRVRDDLLAFIAHFESFEALDWQSEYDGLFERGRAVSLHIFEHVHGESRDRGQAMVDLMGHYRSAGLALSERELPDYLPTYLEFCTTQGQDDNIEGAQGWLQDISHVLALLAARLREKDSPYSLLLDALLRLSEVEVDMAALQQQVSGEERDDTPEALDKIWEDEAVSFSSAQGSACGDSVMRPSESQRRDGQPLSWINAGADQAPQHSA
ncbi:nitrate reductase molybdenum cofactor assembly chaperone [Biformimicrobium ophioploci]|uniref:Nitrate reductase molybdenum cofactor assembly chaperone n=1 Tax=Biformimicrobium ophioploci TaxID=3036711 RepID=A0ABQ6M014_9GAMM|nr:nitrate reductase molybdenum cofactor assembly chaperone [Microbulbifer sp. NKW57]GMG87693.1 nitrate reductase molybdenum cofactor assembly chaperone [Microbulbifer sp. NKW57]